MKGDAIAPELAIYAIPILILSVVAVVVFIGYLQSFGQAQCWRDALSEVRPITGTFEPRTLGIGKLLGLDSFNIGLTLRSSCVDRIMFADLDACTTICRGTDRFDTDEQKCLNECALCLDSKGCIIAVPAVPQSVEEHITRFFSGPIDYGRMLKANIKVFGSPEFSFTPSIFVSPPKGVKITCLQFAKQGDSYAITVLKPDAARIEDCDITEVQVS